MNSWLLRDVQVVNEGHVTPADVLVRDGFIERVATEGIGSARAVKELDGKGRHLLPGAIDDQVHFREPGLTYKEDIAHGSAAAVAGGITTFMEMPNTVPQTLTQDLLTLKYAMGAASSVANYSFYMGASNSNIEEVLRTDPKTVCGLKAFLGSSTGDMLVDNEETLDRLFKEAHMILAVHAEDEPTIRRNMAEAKARYGEDIRIGQHPFIRSAEACWRSSSTAVALAKMHGTRLHVLHISTARELELFEPGPLEGKRITAEACVHHLWFTDADYAKKGTLLKWNPAVKTAEDRDALRQAVKDGRIDVVATDHAPHTVEEKANPYTSCPSGGPLVQHALPAMLELMHQGVFTLQEVVEKMCHAPARLFQVKDRGFIREGQHADLVLVDLDAPWTVAKENLLYKCGWSPFEGQRFRSRVLRTWVNGQLAYAEGEVDRSVRGMRAMFDR
ncbi:MAG: dihydroorotase [Flavobacteriales bacterium]|nr:dihydroorotase [Flavobacteriales bacterium]MBK6893219.1 dihydroorotase [Flavobacteriales bacterium]MBK7285621.1 dihydroorotase [Flavobacteriales bacterium]MBK9599913.1 dihydroorotase [Flavobacteriales bacterium]QQS71296.1 MAG: dihydroorotase [Flavobacteriales bacterium]